MRGLGTLYAGLVLFTALAGLAVYIVYAGRAVMHSIHEQQMLYEKARFIAEHANVSGDTVALPEPADLIVVDPSGVPHVARNARQLKLPWPASQLKIFVAKRGEPWAGAAGPAAVAALTAAGRGGVNDVARAAVARTLSIVYGSGLQPMLAVGYTWDPRGFVSRGFSSGVAEKLIPAGSNATGLLLREHRQNYGWWNGFVTGYRLVLAGEGYIVLDTRTTNLSLFYDGNADSCGAVVRAVASSALQGLYGKVTRFCWGMGFYNPREEPNPYPAGYLAVPFLLVRGGYRQLRLEIAVPDALTAINGTKIDLTSTEQFSLGEVKTGGVWYSVQLRLYDLGRWSPYTVIGVNDTPSRVLMLGSGYLEPGETRSIAIRLDDRLLDRLGPGYDAAIAAVVILYSGDNSQRLIQGWKDGSINFPGYLALAVPSRALLLVGLTDSAGSAEAHINSTYTWRYGIDPRRVVTEKTTAPSYTLPAPSILHMYADKGKEVLIVS